MSYTSLQFDVFDSLYQTWAKTFAFSSSANKVILFFQMYNCFHSHGFMYSMSSARKWTKIYYNVLFRSYFEFQRYALLCHEKSKLQRGIRQVHTHALSMKNKYPTSRSSWSKQPVIILNQNIAGYITNIRRCSETAFFENYYLKILNINKLKTHVLIINQLKIF